MIAGTLTAIPERSLKFIQTSDLDCCVSPNALTISADGQLQQQGAVVANLEAYVQSQKQTNAVRLLPDQDLPAHMLVETIKQLRVSGVKKISIVTENNSQ